MTKINGIDSTNLFKILNIPIGNVSGLLGFSLASAAPSLLTYLSSLNPNHLFLMTTNGSGGVDNLGSAGSTYDAALTLTALDSTTNTGWEGEALINSNNDRVEVSSVFPIDGANGYASDQDRTLLWVWESIGQTGGSANSRVGGNASIIIEDSGGAGQPYQALPEGVAQFAMNTSYSHSSGGSSESLLNTSGRICVLAMVYDVSVEEWTVYWKQSTHASGYSFRSGVSATPSISTGTTFYRFFGAASGLAGRFIAGAHMVMNSTINGSQFDLICTNTGL